MQAWLRFVFLNFADDDADLFRIAFGQAPSISCVLPIVKFLKPDFRLLFEICFGLAHRGRSTVVCDKASAHFDVSSVSRHIIEPLKKRHLNAPSLFGPECINGNAKLTIADRNVTSGKRERWQSWRVRR